MDAVHAIPGTTPSAMDARLTGSVEGVSLCTSFTFTQRPPKEELKTRTSSWSELPRIVKNTKPTMSSQALKLGPNHELSTDNTTVASRPHGRNASRPRLAGAGQEMTFGIPFETFARRLWRPMPGRQD